MDTFVIEGGNRLNGEIELQGSKNATLPILAACVMIESEVTLTNVPEIDDVKNLLDIIRGKGANIIKSRHVLSIDCSQIQNKETVDETVKKLRSSVFLLGPLLSRFKSAVISFPGGCQIGKRPIDIHINAFKEMGVVISEEEDRIVCDAREIHSAEISLSFPSVGATENIIMAAAQVNGITVIKNAAKEPEIVELQNFLNACGGKIHGAGTDVIFVEGVERLCGTEYTIASDRIALGTYLLAVGVCGGCVKVKNVIKYTKDEILFKLLKSSCKTEFDNDIIIINSEKCSYCVPDVTTGPYPDFSTDLQASYAVYACFAEGETHITERVFENRFGHMIELQKMGANIEINDRKATLYGVKKLFGREVFAKDLRGGAALVTAGMAAQGITVIRDIHHIDRGYESIEKVYNILGAKIYRT